MWPVLAGGRMFILRVETLSVWDLNGRNSRKKNIIESSNINRACASLRWAQALAVPHKLGGLQQRVSAPCRKLAWNQTHAALLTTTCLNNWATGLYWSQSAKTNNCIWLVMSSKLEMIFFACRNPSQHWFSSRIFIIKSWCPSSDCLQLSSISVRSCIGFCFG